MPEITPHPSLTTARDLLSFVEASPTPAHCVAESARRLEAAGFSRLHPEDRWQLQAGGRHYLRQHGAMVAFALGTGAAVDHGFRILGAHTDSPNLRIKPVADLEREGYLQLGVEVYGGCLTYTWLDRDLTLAGTVYLRAASGPPTPRLVHLRDTLLRIPSLAIHMQRDVRTEGLKLNDQQHLPPILGLGSTEASATPGSLRRLLGDTLGVAPADIVAWDLALADAQPPTLAGLADTFVLGPRLDNQAMCHATLSALLRSRGAGVPAATSVVCLYDHEEVGSGSTGGAGGALVEHLLVRLCESEGPAAGSGGLMRAAARSWQISADMAHAVHPNFADRHEPKHTPRLNGGPVLKQNSQQRYATDAEGLAMFSELCAARQVPMQHYVVRTDLPCGTTIGPIAGARLGIRTLDVGNPMLSMHSIREQGGSRDPESMVDVLSHFLSNT